MKRQRLKPVFVYWNDEYYSTEFRLKIHAKFQVLVDFCQNFFYKFMEIRGMIQNQYGKILLTHYIGPCLTDSVDFLRIWVYGIIYSIFKYLGSNFFD